MLAPMSVPEQTRHEDPRPHVTLHSIVHAVPPFDGVRLSVVVDCQDAFDGPLTSQALTDNGTPASESEPAAG